MTTLGQFLRTKRLMKGYTTKEIAAVLQIPYPSYYAYEVDKNTPRTPVLQKLADYYGLHIQELQQYLPGDSITVVDEQETVINETPTSTTSLWKLEVFGIPKHYQIGDKVWTLHMGEPKEYEVNSIQKLPHQGIIYHDINNDFIECHERCYATKEDLIKAQIQYWESELCL